MKNIFKIIFVIIGTIIGAGFASGKEIYVFFVRYGPLGSIGIIISCTIMSLIVRKVMLIITNCKINNYKEFTVKLFAKNNIINEVLNSIINIFLLATFYIMIAGFSTYFKQQYNMPIIIGAFMISFCCYFCLSKKAEGIVKFSNVLVPIIIIIIMGIGIKGLSVNQTVLEKNIYVNPNKLTIIKLFINIILYASYNSIILIPTIISLKNHISQKNIKFIWIISWLILATLSIVIYVVLNSASMEALKTDLPISYLARGYGKIYEYIYGIVIISSIFTSVISAGYGFLENVAKNKKSYTQILNIMCITSMIFSYIGFSNLVEFLYPIFGLLGIIQIFLLFKIKLVTKHTSK